MVNPEIIGEIEQVETIARGPSFRDRRELVAMYGEHRRNQWRKKKGVELVRLEDGEIMRAEVHWCEAVGIGKVGMKVKNFLYDD